MTDGAKVDGANSSAEEKAGARDSAEEVPHSSAPPVSDRLGKAWRWLGERDEEWLDTAPPDRRYLLATKNDRGEERGLLPLGKVGMLAAAGGAGKSWALVQLALSVATGKDWLGGFRVTAPGAVLLALGEEEAEEMRRRLYKAAKLMNLTADERAKAAENIMPLPLCGEPVALTYGADEARLVKNYDPADPRARETPLARELQQRLAGAGVEWRLVVLDPVSRFAGPDVEIDNAAATRFVQALERLTRAPGGPTVLVAHHTNKGSRTGETTAGAARGSSALTDGVRWQANLENLPDLDTGERLAVLRVVKNNYGTHPPPHYLCRDDEHDGALRAATAKERDGYEAAERTEIKGRETKPTNKNGTEETPLRRVVMGDD